MRIAVALSGGHDSTFAAVKLLREGHSVVGITAKLVPDDWPAAAAAKRSIEAAAAVCRELGIPHHVADLSDQFLRDVVEYFVKGYSTGLTPNPCLVCNKAIKFGALLDFARRLGCQVLATGHYAIKTRRGDRWAVRRGVDERKEQSYALMFLTQGQLSAAIFPLGEHTKESVVRQVQTLGLPVLRAESQDVCFIVGTYADFVAQFVKPEPGPILDLDGRQLGTHRGLIYYTVGQRRGLGLRTGRPLYVIAKDPRRNALIVGPEELLHRRLVEVHSVNWVSIAPPEPGSVLSCMAMIRYRAPLIPAQATVLQEGRLLVRLDEHSQAPAPGQGLALYDAEGYLLAGGFIAPALSS